MKKRSRRYCFVFAFILSSVLLIAAADGPGAKPGVKPQWKWTVEISDGYGNLISDGGPYQDAGNVIVRVLREAKGAYGFALQVQKGSVRKIGLQGVELTHLKRDPSKGPGYFPSDSMSCSQPNTSCDGECGLVFQGFLNRQHPTCGYASTALQFTVSLDIESMGVGELRDLENEFVGFNIVYDWDTILQDPGDQFHNMDAQNNMLPTDQSRRWSPLAITRSGPNTWVVSSHGTFEHYVNYAEFYKTFFHGTRWTYSIPMAADGPFEFMTTWTRSQIGVR